MSRTRYNIFYSEDVYSHLELIDKKYWPMIKENIKEQLSFAPDVETRNRKPLTSQVFDDRWEIRFGPQNSFRVFYKIDSLNKEILILAVGVKIKEKLFIGKREIKL